MRTSKFSEEQIIGFLRQAEAGMPIKQSGRKHGFSGVVLEAARWVRGGDAGEARPLRELELASSKLKRRLAEAILDMHSFKSVLGTKR